MPSKKTPDAIALLKAGSVEALIKEQPPTAVAVVASAKTEPSSAKTGVVTSEGRAVPSRQLNPPEIARPKAPAEPARLAASAAPRKPAKPRATAPRRAAARPRTRPTGISVATVPTIQPTDVSATDPATRSGRRWWKAVAGGIGALAAGAALLSLKGSSRRKAHQADGTDSSKSFDAGIPDKGTIPEEPTDR